MKIWLAVFTSLFLSVPTDSAEPAHDCHENWPHIATAVEQCEGILFGDPKELRKKGAEGLAVVVRVLDECERNRQLILRDHPSESQSLTTVTVRETGIRSHLERAKSRSSEISVADTCSALEVDTTELGDEAAGELRATIARLRALEISPTFETAFPIHGTHYRIWVFSGNTYSFFEFFGFAGSPDSKLQAWVDGLIELAGLRCSARDS